MTEPRARKPQYRTREQREADGDPVFTGRQDWSLFIRETVDETIDRVFSTGDFELCDDDTRAHIHEIIAVELERQAHRFKSRTSLLAPNNVAYHLTARAEEIRKENPL